MSRIASKEQKLIATGQEAWAALKVQRATPSYNTILAYIENELEIKKNELLDAEGTELARRQGEARALRYIVQNLRNPKSPVTR